MQKIFDRYDYDPQNVIGIGGMGTVYRGSDTHEGHQPVAIKYLKPEVIKDNPQIIDRFRQEGEALRELNHPNIVKMLEAGSCDNNHYLVMEYISGGSLRDLLNEQPQLSVQRILYIALDLADALTRAHRLNILHRDIKPGNVLLADDGTPYLTDFGVARTHASDMTQDGQLVGTLAYISPESITGGVVDERHDIWAFGVMLFEMLVGRRPFQSEAVGSLIAEITNQPLPDLEKLRPDVPVALIDLIYRMLDRNLDTRIRSVRQVGLELERIIHSDGDDMPVALLPTIAADRFRSTSMERVVDANATITTPSLVSNRPVGLVNVSAQSTPFVGRIQEVEAVSALLRDNNVRLVSLVGPGGTGKTRISLAVAEEVKNDFPDGVYFVPLASVDRPERVPTRIAEVLGFQFSGGDDPMEEMMAFMRDKTALVILDNMEHLVHGAQLLAQHIEMAPFVKVLATSRERLRLRGENVYEVDSMLIPEDDTPHTPDALLNYPSVQLFMSSAKRIAPAFELTPETAPPVARIIQLVHGMPLGIELAAGWLEMLPVDEIVTEIENSLDFLETDLRDMPERHRSIRAVFDYSWNLMDQAERDTFMKLAIFRGGFDRSAARQIIGASLRTLTGLVNKSLLFRQPNGRYTVAKLSRQYAQEQFDQQATDAYQLYEKYVEFYTDFLEKLNPLFGSKRDLQAMNTIDNEIENVRYALTLSTQHTMLDQLERITLPLSQYYLSRSLLLEAISNYEEILATLADTGQADTYAYWQIQALLTTVLGRQGNYIRSEQVAQQVLTYMRENNMTHEKPSENFILPYTLNALAYANMMLGEYDKGRQNTHDALNLSENLDEKYDFVRAIAMGNLGYLEYLAGNLREAKRISEELSQVYYSLDKSPIGYAFGQNNLGEITLALGDVERAQQLFQRAYDTFKSFRHKRGMAFSANNLAGCYTASGAYDEANKLYKKAYRLNKETGDRAGLGHSLSAMANMALFEGDWQQAYEYYRKAMDLRKEIGDRLGYARNLTEAGTMLYMLGRVDQARPYYEEASEIAEQLDSDMLRSFVAVGRGGLQLADGDNIQAMHSFRRAVDGVGGLKEDNTPARLVMMSMLWFVYERGLDEAAAKLIGFLWHHVNQASTAGPDHLPTLDKIRQDLKTRMGPAYEAAYQQGVQMPLSALMDTLLSP
jgi:serine/threonine protein kinase/tetratricopeptide (TPR) repeat protein